MKTIITTKKAPAGGFSYNPLSDKKSHRLANGVGVFEEMYQRVFMAFSMVLVCT